MAGVDAGLSIRVYLLFIHGFKARVAEGIPRTIFARRAIRDEHRELSAPGWAFRAATGRSDQRDGHRCLQYGYSEKGKNFLQFGYPGYFGNKKLPTESDREGGSEMGNGVQ